MTDREIADRALSAITLEKGEYEKWRDVTMAYKAMAGDDGADFYDAWNRRQPNNKGDRDLEDYKGMTPDGGIGGGTLIKIAKEYGYTPEGGAIMPNYKNVEIKNEKATTITMPQWDKYEDGNRVFYSVRPQPAPADRWSQRCDYISHIFHDGDYVTAGKRRCINAENFTYNEMAQWSQLADETDPATSDKIDLRGLYDDGDDADPEKEKGGVFICINPTNGKGRNDADVIEYRNTLIETDDKNLSIDAQINILEKSGIPILALTKTGGKSVHAVTYVGAGSDRELYNKRVNYLHRYLFERFGFLCDPADKNPARLTRMAGFLRWDKDGTPRSGQELIMTGSADNGDPWDLFFEMAESLKTTTKKSFANMTSEEIERIKDIATFGKTGESKERAKIEINNAIKADREKRAWLYNGFLTPDPALSIINYYKNNPPTSTGIASIDGLLNGGILGDFYVLGGTSGMGKTTLFLQIATALARTGCRVFYYSFEQDAGSIAIKILSQLGAAIAVEKYGRAGLYTTPKEVEADHALKAVEIINKVKTAQRAKKAPTVRDILINGDELIKGGRYFTSEECETFSAAVEEFRDIKTLYIREADRTYTAQKIIDDMTMAGEEFGDNKCVLFVDYLQKVPAPTGLTDKQALDVTTATLHELSRSRRIPIFALSSLNRESYKGETARTAEVTLASFKESGGIEYDVDVALGLQVDGDTPIDRKNRLEKLHDVGSIYLRTTLLKSRRGGKLGEHASLEFFPEYDFFLTAENEDAAERDDVTSDDGAKKTTK